MFGRTSIQTVLPLSSKAGAIKLTTAYWWTPQGRSVSGTGIVPDVLLKEGVRSDKYGALDLDPHLVEALRILRATDSR